MIDLAVEYLTCNEWVFVSSVVSILSKRHDSDIIDQLLESIVLKVLDQLFVVIFKFLNAVIIVEKLVDRTVLTIQQILNRGTALAPVVGPKVAA